MIGRTISHYRILEKLGGGGMGGVGRPTTLTSELVDLRVLTWNRLVPFLHGLKESQVKAA